MSTTPRTDVASNGYYTDIKNVARQLETELTAMTARAEKAEAELAAERERHNALRQAVLDVLCDPEGKACFRGSNADRAAIDSAMKEASK